MHRSCFVNHCLGFNASYFQPFPCSYSSSRAGKPIVRWTEVLHLLITLSFILLLLLLLQFHSCKRAFVICIHLVALLFLQYKSQVQSWFQNRQEHCPSKLASSSDASKDGPHCPKSSLSNEAKESSQMPKGVYFSPVLILIFCAAKLQNFFAVIYLDVLYLVSFNLI